MSVPRVQYRERQILQAADLQDEQQFLLDTLSRHTLNAHSPGIVRGLAIHVDADSGPVVDPGIAVDGNGRQLVLWQTESLANQLADADVTDVWLIFCSEQLTVSMVGRSPCQPSDYGRTRELARVRCVPTGSDPPDSAGVLLGSVQINPDKNEYSVDVSKASYAMLRGANVSNPTQSAFIQVGKSYRADPNELQINVTDDSGKATTRVALNTQRGIFIYGDVQLSSYRARGLISVDGRSALLLVEAAIPGPLGERIAVSAESRQRGVTLIFTDVVTGKTESLEELDFSVKKNTRDKAKAKLTRFNRESRLVRLQSADAEEAEDSPRLHETDEDRLTTAGSSILLADILAGSSQTVPEHPGCQETNPRSDRSRSVNGLSFLPASAVPIPGSPARGIYSVKLDPKDSQSQEFRLDLGKHQDQDLSKRLTIGTMIVKEKRFLQWLTVQGDCAIELVDHQHSAKRLATSIKARGYIEQAPIKADPSDPLFKSLMVAAWLNGLRSAVAASSSVSIVFNSVPKPIGAGPAWSYKVDVTNIGSQTLSVDKVIEIMTYDGQTVVQSISYTGNLSVGATASIVVDHSSVPETANTITLEVIVSGKIASASWWNSVTTTTTA